MYNSSITKPGLITLYELIWSMTYHNSLAENVLYCVSTSYYNLDEDFHETSDDSFSMAHQPEKKKKKYM